LERLLAELQPLIDKVWRLCEDKGMRGRTVTLKAKFDDFELISRSKTVPGTIGRSSDLANVSAELLKALIPMKKAVRLLGVSVSGFVGDETDEPGQMALEL
jgi:DNA polymerase IV